MIVIFVSQCHKKSIKQTRRILDSYANRIGERTWKTVITEEGLKAVRKRLTAVATKSTAVACHRVRGNQRTELVWIVGKQNEFDQQGNVPVHRTGRNLLRESDEGDWYLLPVLKSLVAVAGLFHDFGKAWRPFQRMLRAKSQNDANRDPVRHEWISLLLFQAFVDQRPDDQWIEEMVTIKDKPTPLRKSLTERVIGNQAIQSADIVAFPESMTPLQRWIGWLILGHHRLPQSQDVKPGPSVLEFELPYKLQQVRTSAQILYDVSIDHGYRKFKAPPFDAVEHWKFDAGLPWEEQLWCLNASRWGHKLRDVWHRHVAALAPEQLAHVERKLLTIGRACLMLGDQGFSSTPPVRAAELSSGGAFANTIKRKELYRLGFAKSERSQPIYFRQTLVEHLVGVTKNSTAIVHLIPKLERELPRVNAVRALRKPSHGKFTWQNKATQSIRSTVQAEHLRIENTGFFGLNMASTGLGKTFANAKIINEISPDGLRYSLALGLRTLTLQTGDEYRERLQLDASQVAVLIGSKIIKYLHEYNQSSKYSNNDQLNGEEEIAEWSGSESLEALDSGIYLDYDGSVGELFRTVLASPKQHQFLHAPIAVCTIDHLMPAVENTRGGRQILPLLRMLSADLVLDEVDDYDLNDLPAVARLVHTAGMLGRRVLLSSATIPPAVAEGLFQAYRSGWQIFATTRQRSPDLLVHWCDEFTAKSQMITDPSSFQAKHTNFVKRRSNRLSQKNVVIQKGSVLPLADLCPAEPIDPDFPEEEIAAEETWFDALINAGMKLHETNHIVHPDGQKISVGIIRLANVDPCIRLARYLLDQPIDDSKTAVKVLPYHARQVLLLRSETERILDSLLKRNAQDYDLSRHPLIQMHLDANPGKDLVVIVIASPVAEVGRDHDYDWGVVSPSSMRSIIQMAGRIRRHRRDQTIEPINLIIPEFNRKGFLKLDSKLAFHRPGFETNRYHLNTHSVIELGLAPLIEQSVDARPRIVQPKSLDVKQSLRDLEHFVLREILTTQNSDRSFLPVTVNGWCCSAFYLVGISQRCSPFRRKTPDESYTLHVLEDGNLELRYPESDDRYQGKVPGNLEIGSLDDRQKSSLFLSHDYANLIEHHRLMRDQSIENTCEQLGSVTLMMGAGGDRQNYIYIPELGFERNKGE